MLNISGYILEEKIHESDKTSVYRVKKEPHNQSYILKILKEQHPSPRDIARLQYEHELTSSLDIEEIIHSYGVENQGNSWFLILEDFGGVSLREILNSKKLDLKKLLELTIRVTNTLGKVHQENIIHKDIKPSNLIYNIKTDMIKIGDFGISTRLTREDPSIRGFNNLEGTLEYISPEQTGRMNRALDYRTDFYSLGATLYEFLTGSPPFETRDSVEMVHCHIAKIPRSPQELNHEIPEMLSKIVLKLLAKNAEDRYQSAFGLSSDLEECLRQLKSEGNIKNFTLAANDITDKFQITQKLYGREKHIETLLKTFKRIERGRCELLLVTGYSGIGKSSLVNETHKPITASRGYFIRGKFDQFQRNIPFSALIQAFKSLMNIILTQNEEDIQLWKIKLLAACGPNGQILIDVIPELELVIGEQAPVTNLSAAESQNRFSLVFQNFIRVFAQAEHPLVLFLDDLQWADTPTLKLIKFLLTDPENRHLLLLGAYRDNEVDQNHPLEINLREVTKDGGIVDYIHLETLPLEDLNNLVADSLRCVPGVALPLSRLILKKTLGNPFFVNHYLNNLNRKGLLEFDNEKRRWTWTAEEIEKTEITDNVIDFMGERLMELPEKTQKILQLASCMGNKFPLYTLALIANQSPEITRSNLKPALDEGLIFQEGSAGKPLSHRLETKSENTVFKFLHDHIQQAAYSLIEESQKQKVHLDIGRRLLADMTPQEQDENIFEIVGHLNAGKDLIKDFDEKLNAARLNKMAGEKAKDSTAYDPAGEHFRVGLEFLPEERWEKYYDLAYPMTLDLSECEYLTGNLKGSEELYELLLNKSRSNLEKADIYHFQINQFIGSGRGADALEAGKTILNVFDIDLPEENKVAAAYKSEVRKIKKNLKGRQIEDLIDEPEVSDPEVVRCMTILLDLWFAAYLAGNQNLVAYVTAKNLNLCLKHGNNILSTVIYVVWGMICSGSGQHEQGYQFGALAVNLTRKYHARSVMAKSFQLYTFIHHWVQPVRTEFRFLKEGYQAGLECGDVINSNYCIANLLRNRMLGGESLELVYDECKSYPSFSLRIKDMFFYEVMTSWINFLLALRNKTEPAFSLNYEDFNEEEYAAKLEDPAMLLFRCFYINLKVQLLYLAGRLKEAYQFTLEGRKIGLTILLRGQLQTAEFNFYGSLTAAAYYEEAPQKQKLECLEILKENQKTMRAWSKVCTENFEHKYLLVEAERSRIKNGQTRAMNLYDEAIDSANKNGYTQHEALANYLAGKFYISRGRKKAAQAYLKDAHYLYELWGATVLVKKLEEEHPETSVSASSYRHTLTSDTTSGFERNSATLRASTTNTNTGSITGTGNIFDMAAVLKASQAIAGEIVLEQLLEGMMRILMENAGAQSGILLLEKEGILYIEAECGIDDESIKVLQNIPLVSDNPGQIETRLPLSIINWVARTRQDVVLIDAGNDQRFNDDSYIAEGNIKSVIASPIINQRKLVGILYLENNLTQGAFTRDRLEILNILSAQAAVSIENALLYRTLDAKVEERTQELKNAQAKLIQSEKMASLGQLVAGIAHEINTPMGAINASIDNISISMKEMIQKLEGVIQKIPANKLGLFISLIDDPMNESRQLTTREERAYKRGLVKNLEDLEIHNATYIAETLVKIGVVEKIDKYIPLFQEADNRMIVEMAYNIARQNKNTENIKIAIDRVSKIVFALKSFSHFQNEDSMVSADLTDGLETVLVLYHNQIKHGIELVKSFQKIPRVFCYPDELIQVWTNVIHNAIQAMEGKGKLIIKAFEEDSYVIVTITDDGPGIPEEYIKKIFDPFFTTKPKGEGTGLGLGICQRIIDKHKGKIKVKSSPGKTTFSIFVPINVKDKSE